jgi:hypothetical protein
MTVWTSGRSGFFALTLIALSACSLIDGPANSDDGQGVVNPANAEQETRRETIWDMFENVDDPNVTVEVNRFIWIASLEVLDFLPIESADPFSGIIDFGYGTPPGGGTAYRATVQVNDPALDARSLRVALATRGGPVSRETTRQIEDAILTRARQLRIRDSGL